MIVLGYVVFAIWMPIMFITGELLERKTNLGKEVIRKIQHILTSMGWLFGAIFFGPTIHIVIINFLGFIGLTIATFTDKLNFTKREDAKRSYGLMYFGLGTLIVIILGVYIVPDLFYLTSIPYYCLAFADGLAPLIAKAFKIKNIKITKDKSLVGSSAVFIISFLVSLLINLILQTNFDIYFLLTIASLCTVLELFGKKGADNLLIEIGIFALLMLNYFNLITTPLVIAILIAPPILILALIKKSITIEAAMMGLIMSTSISFFSKEPLLILIMVLFISAEIVSKICRKIREKKETHNRGFYQIFSITIMAIIMSFIYYMTNDIKYLYIGYLSIIAQFSDSMASDIGSLSKEKPIDIIRGNRVEKGISGGVSILGSVSALITSIFGGFIVLLLEGNIYPVLITIVTLSFFSTIIDSILGSLVQAKYQCPTCNNITDNKTCCNSQTTLVGGIKFINNTSVNLITSVITTLIALVLFTII